MKTVTHKHSVCHVLSLACNGNATKGGITDLINSYFGIGQNRDFLTDLCCDTITPLASVLYIAWISNLSLDV